jgi:curved DNA-binding protein CbpA
LSTLYEILGLSKSATPDQIKSAYRKLAKIYHPDKNHGNKDAEEKFKSIKDAYDILSDVVKKKKYDLSIESKNNIHKNSNKQKNYTEFTQEELKRRRYYQEYYTKEYNKHKEKEAFKEQKQYNETRALIVLVPIALALVFFIINIYNHSTSKNYKFQNPVSTKVKSIKVQSKILTQNKTGDEPFSSIINKTVVDKTSNDVIILRNNLDSDAIVFVSDYNNKIVRHYYIEKKIEFFLEYLPQEKLNLSLLVGVGLNCNLKENDKVKTFCENNNYYKYLVPLQINNNNPDSIYINFKEDIDFKKIQLFNDTVYYNLILNQNLY